MGKLRNSVILTGHLGKDVNIHTFESGKKKAEVTLATKERWKGKDGQDKEETQWHNLVAWGTTAELMKKHLKKGQRVNIEGRLTYRNFTDKDGIQRTIAEVVINEFIP